MSKNVILITLSGRFPSAFTITGLKLTHISTLPVGQTAFNAQWICNAEGFIHCDKPTESQLCRAFWHNISSALIMNTASIYPLSFSGWHHFEYVLFFLLPWKLKSCKWHVHCGGFKKINGQKWNWNIYIQFSFLFLLYLLFYSSLEETVQVWLWPAAFTIFRNHLKKNSGAICSIATGYH